MDRKTSNDNSTARPDDPESSDSHGRAAILLVESLLHELVESKVLSLDQAIGVVNTAAEVKVDEDMGDGGRPLSRSANLLKLIAKSMSHDLPKK